MLIAEGVQFETKTKKLNTEKQEETQTSETVNKKRKAGAMEADTASVASSDTSLVKISSSSSFKF